MIPSEIENILSGHYDVSRETISRLEIYVSELLKWQERINLIGPSTADDVWKRHIIDSLHLLPLIQTSETSLLDLGSGAGLPGLILAVAGIRHVTLVESDSKKCAFLREAARITHTPLNIENCRIEKLSPKPFEVITSRALAPLGKLLELCECFTDSETICLFPKGKNYSNELDDAMKQWGFEYIKHSGAPGGDGFVLEIRRLRRLHPL